MTEEADRIVVVWRDAGAGAQQLSTHLDADGRLVTFSPSDAEAAGTQFVAVLGQVLALLNTSNRKVSTSVAVARELNPEWEYAEV
jgi:hypothetical protein